MEPKPPTRRSRDGCWTCKRRRKKCDSIAFPCGNCKRLDLKCEAETRLVWEDDVRRDGMRRRGPAKSAGATSQANNVERDHPASSRSKGEIPPRDDPGEPATSAAQVAPGWEVVGLRRISQWPFDLDQAEFQLLSHYAQRFSRVYPAFAGPTNPFLQVFLPLSMQCRTVLDAVLALSSVQSWENGGFSMEKYMLKLRHQALRGCGELIRQVMTRPDIQHEIQQSPSVGDALQHMAYKASTAGGNDIIHLLATCGLLLLYEKLSGESEENGTAHLQFFARLFPLRHFTLTDGPSQSVGQTQWNEAIRFLSILFLYNDVVRSTSFRTPTLSTFPVGEKTPPPASFGGPHTQETQESAIAPDLRRFEFPKIISRISSGDLSVTDAEIAAWDGRLDWFPSFALLPPEKVEPRERLPTSDSTFVHDPFFLRLRKFMCPENWPERVLISELYRIAGTVYRKQCILHFKLQAERNNMTVSDPQDAQMGNLPQWATDLIRLLSPDSPFQNTLLWPIAIVAKELSMQHEREYIVCRLRSLEQMFNMKHFCVVREHLHRCWMMRDQGIVYEEEQPVLFG